MAVTARRTLAKVKSSAIRPRHPEVPNLMGEVVMRRYFRTERVESRKLKVRSQEEPWFWVGHGRKAAASLRTRGCDVRARRRCRADGRGGGAQSDGDEDLW